MITVITAIYDRYDSLKPVLSQTVDCRWICVTDSYSTVEKGESGWEIICEPRGHLNPRVAGKTPKCLPWLYTGDKSSVWIDASYQVISPQFVEEVMDLADPIAQFKHPLRDCAYDEAVECALIPKDSVTLLKAQEWKLWNIREHPRNWGLWATGVIARRHTPDVIQMGFEWLAEIYNHSSRDQVSQPDVLRRNGLRPANLPGTHIDNPWLSYQGSDRHNERMP